MYPQSHSFTSNSVGSFGYRYVVFPKPLHETTIQELKSPPRPPSSSTDRNTKHHKLPLPVLYLLHASAFPQRAVLLQAAVERQV
jgi:hypothetical protein